MKLHVAETIETRDIITYAKQTTSEESFVAVAVALSLSLPINKQIHWIGSIKVDNQIECGNEQIKVHIKKAVLKEEKTEPEQEKKKASWLGRIIPHETDIFKPSKHFIDCSYQSIIPSAQTQTMRRRDTGRMECWQAMCNAEANRPFFVPCHKANYLCIYHGYGFANSPLSQQQLNYMHAPIVRFYSFHTCNRLYLHQNASHHSIV